ncbi:MAG: DNA helicase RecQ [Acidobacteria bacterium]|nr:DNA helicase RecQ [Acidobacteriota bacterium]
MTAREVLLEVFGFSAFLPHQEEVVDALVAGRDAFVVMPTGGGKSLCYQVPALVRPGTGVVVSPLISLMKDQVDALRANGVRAAAYNSALGEREARRTLARLHAGELDLLYIAPERLLTDAFLERLRDLPLALFAVDEAHCISMWGHDFRPEYLALSRLRDLFPGVPLAALTASADRQTRDDIVRKLGLEDALNVLASFDRPNIRYAVEAKHSPFQQLVKFLAARPYDAGIVYCLSRKRTEEVAAKLRGHGVSASAYHAGLADGVRRQVQEDFSRDRVRVVAATIAFGMGIDKSNVRFVVHYDLPKNVEGYYQETGRAGRDGLPAEALLLYSPGDLMAVKGLIEKGENPERVRIELHKLNAMAGLASSATCRRRALLAYFGEARDADCGNCDVCSSPPRRYDATVDAQKILSCVWRTGQRFGVNHVVDVLRGADTKKIRDFGHQRLSTYGIGKDRPGEAWKSLVRQLVHLGYLEVDLERFSALLLTPAARPVMRGTVALELTLPAEVLEPPAPGAAKKRGRAEAAVEAGVWAGAGAEPDEVLFQLLRKLRRQLAEEENVAPFIIFGDAALKQMAARRPATLDAFGRTPGVGAFKLRRYGPVFVELIQGYLRETGG